MTGGGMVKMGVWRLEDVVGSVNQPWLHKVSDESTETMGESAVQVGLHSRWGAGWRRWGCSEVIGGERSGRIRSNCQLPDRNGATIKSVLRCDVVACGGGGNPLNPLSVAQGCGFRCA